MYAAECWRVLRDDGTMWVNLGDSYAGSNQGVMADGTQVAGKKQTTNAGSVNGLTGMRGKDLPGLKPKDIIGIPWAVAFALRSDGWYLRQDIVWAKSCSGAYTGGSCMPESVTDRMTKSHEYVFLLSKSQEYYFDHIAIREAAHYDGRAATMMRGSKKYANGFVPNQPEQTCHARGHERWNWEDGQAYRNRRSVWTVNPKPYSGAHYATWPPDLVEPMIRAGTSEHGCCPDCGAPWERVADHVPATSKKCPKTDAIYQAQGGNGEKKTGTIGMSGGGRIDGSVTTIGWQPTCDCDAGDPIPCTVLDPFAGSGTTLVVARQLGRSAIGLDLSLKYMRDNARTRLEFDQLGAWESGAVGGNGDCDLADLPLFSNGAG
jgi:DNA modification methylase